MVDSYVTTFELENVPSFVFHWSDINNSLSQTAILSVSRSLSPSLVCPHVFPQAALTTLDQRVLSKVKRLNAVKHTTQTHQCRLDQLKTEYQRMRPEGRGGAPSADARTRKKEEDAMVVTS